MMVDSLLPRDGFNRRAFLQGSSLVLTGALTGGIPLAAIAKEDSSSVEPTVRLGLMTDIHYADRNPAGSRHYRDSISKVREAIGAFNAQNIERLIHLGDLIDSGDTVEKELNHLKTIEAEFKKFDGPRNYVLGNHCVSRLTKAEFLENTAASAAHLSFDHGPFHFVVLDACYRADGVAYGRNNFEWTDANIPVEQVEWLQDDLATTDKPTIVFAHQRLDGEGEENHAVKNAAEIRTVLEESEKVLAVFMGHSHQNTYSEVEGIHYCVLRAVVEGPGAENGSYALMDLFEDGSIKITGLRKQDEYHWNRCE